MRGEVFGLGLAFAVLFSGPLPELNGSLMHEEAAAPAWLSIPAGASIAEIGYSGSAGQEQTRGMIRLSVEGEAGKVLDIMKTRLALQGFVVGERQFSTSISHPMSGIVTARNPATGQVATLVRAESLLGEELRISFIEARPQSIAESN